MDRELLRRPSVEVAPLLLGALFTHRDVTLRITEVEAYLSDVDPGSHSFRGKTPRNSVMWGEPGHLYTYFTYGMHVCANIVCSPDGESSAVLLRAGEIVDGIELARLRRTSSKVDTDLARGPARLAVAMDLTLAMNGADLAGPDFALEFPATPSPFEQGPRTGVSGAGGTAAFPWRFWIPGDPTVLPYKAHVPKKRS
ncbi:DNA-3-methyladenine glycosylase [Glaciihabitans sp. dw_435]|uniref:DNA-3-methyladenine glycosylase n=1 Tax=Glaciihabitans sp. dw_435 TaxID=2720081 RepID=UPI001BD46E0A|nr:DNA-3-methyladenine glycosylase [Glaciihabitans sp. dw_435]